MYDHELIAPQLNVGTKIKTQHAAQLLREPAAGRRFYLPNRDRLSFRIRHTHKNDAQVEEDRFVLYAEKEDFGMVQSKLEELGITPEEASLERIPTTKKEVEEETLEQVMKLIDVIEEDEDVIKVYHNIEG